MRFRTIAIFVLPLMFNSYAYSQRQPGIGAPVAPAADRLSIISGTVAMPDGSSLTQPVKVTLKVMRGDVATIYTDVQGRFLFGSVSPGTYTIEVDADRDHRFEITKESVQVMRGSGPTMVTLYLKEKQDKARATAGKTISVGMLDQKVPATAKKEFQKATHFTAEGNEVEAIAALKRAIAIYPNYLAARNDLGAQLLERGELDEAANELRTAISIDPGSFNPQLNLGIVLFRQNKFSEAVAVLDRALTIEPSAPAAHLYAGIALAKLDDLTRAEKELDAAYNLGGDSYSVALLHLGNLYLKRGERQVALKSFESYLRASPEAADAAQIKKLIDKLR